MEFLFHTLLAVGLYCFMIECLDSFVLFFIFYLSAAASPSEGAGVPPPPLPSLPPAPPQQQNWSHWVCHVRSHSWQTRVRSLQVITAEQGNGLNNGTYTKSARQTMTFTNRITHCVCVCVCVTAAQATKSCLSLRVSALSSCLYVYLSVCLSA